MSVSVRLERHSKWNKRVRKKSNLQLTRRILGDVWGHPNNRNNRLRAVIRAFTWQAYKRLSGRSREITVYDSYKLRAQPSSDSASNLFYFGDRYDVDEMMFLERYLTDGDCSSTSVPTSARIRCLPQP